MRSRIRRKPSGSMAVAFMALLIALGGTAYALPGSNVVSSGDIINGAVRTQDIRNSTVRGGDVRNNTLTGNDINESSLGSVPRANAANSANSANFAGAASIAGAAFNSATVNQIDPADLVVLTEGESETLATRGPVTVTLSCADANANNLGEALVTFTTTEGSATPGNQTLASIIFTPVTFSPAAPFPQAIGEAALSVPTSITRPNDETSWGNLLVAGGATAQAQAGLAGGLGTCIGAMGLVD